MKDKVADFEDRFALSSARIYAKEQKTMLYIDKGYKICVASNGSTYLTMESAKSKLRAEYIMLKVMDIVVNGIAMGVYEGDIVDYFNPEDGERKSGVIIFDKRKLMYSIKPAFSGEELPTYQVKVLKVLGNIYETPEFLNYNLQGVYKALKEEMLPYDISEKEKNSVKTENRASYSAVDEEIPGLGGTKENLPIKNNSNEIDVWIGTKSKANKVFWGYRFLSGGKEKMDKRAFNTQGDKIYYDIASLIIALGNLSKTGKRVYVHTNSKAVLRALDDGVLQNLEKGNWQVNGKKVPYSELLQKVKAEIDRLAVSVTPVEVRSDVELSFVS